MIYKNFFVLVFTFLQHFSGHGFKGPYMSLIFRTPGASCSKLMTTLVNV